MAQATYGSIATNQNLTLEFSVSHRRKGTVSVSVRPDDEPEVQGMDLLFPNTPASDFLGFPLCHATVQSAAQARGYASMYGWIQLVRCNQSKSGDAKLSDADEWEMDPIPITSDLNTPFVWFGPEPSLFDGPSRPRDLQVDWICRSYLAYIGDVALTRDVRPILGFEWGFWMRGGEVFVKPLQRLEDNAWSEHLGLLRNKFAGWTFHDGEDNET